VNPLEGAITYMSNIQLADNLKYLRKRNNLKQNEVSDLLNISRQAYSNYETGIRTPDLDTLLYLCRFYDVTLNDLVITNLRGSIYSADIVSEGKTPYSVGIDKNTGNKIYLSDEETDIIMTYRTLSNENRQIITGFLKSHSLD
jgi:transcriptional regulator with XRE-family HTH domain